MRHNRKRSNIIPADERGTPQPRCHENRGRRIVTPHVLNNGANRICILPGELGDGTRIWCAEMLWTDQPNAVSSLPDGPAWAYTFQACREWVAKRYPLPVSPVPAK
jgi:hypothetical protein